MKIKVIGRRYAETATYADWDKSREFPHFEKEAEQAWEIEAESLTAGEMWLAENHPDMYMGGNVVCENGNFLCLAVPGNSYEKGDYETIAARVDYVRRYVQVC